MVRAHLLASSLLLPAALAAGLYAKDGPVLNLDAKSYKSLIASSNYTSIVEFYAPWCGHCKNLKGAYEKAAKSLSGLAKVGAVNCDDEENKSFCGSMEVKGFPTLKIVRANTNKPGSRPHVEDYQGQRTAKAIVDAVIDKIPNHVSRPKDGALETWVQKGGHKAVLFTDKGTVSALLKSLAIDYLGIIEFAQVRDKETKSIERYGVTKFPTLLLFEDGNPEPKTYSGSIGKEAMLTFLKTVAEPNPDPPKQKAKASKTDKSKASKDSSSLSKMSSSQASKQASTADPSQKDETIIDDGNPLPTVDPIVGEEKPVKLPEAAPPIPTLPDGLSLQQKCLNDKASTCILLLLPEIHPENPYPAEAIHSLSEIHAKHSSSGRKLFPFYQLPKTNSQAGALRKLLKLDEGVEIIAINGKRSWWRRYPHTEYGRRNVDEWIDAIRMGEGEKEKVPTGLIVGASDLPAEQVQPELDEETAALKEKISQQLPDGVDVEFEEIDDAAYEKLIKSSEGKSKSKDEL